jgi:hypothetical protein
VAPSPSASHDDGTRQDPVHDTAAVRPGTSVGQVFAYVAGFVALATIGGVLGWTLTTTPSAGALGPTSSTPVTSPSSPKPSISTPSTPVASTTSGGGPCAPGTLPDYAATPTDFVDARKSLLSESVGVNLRFDASSTLLPGTIIRTSPGACATLNHGKTVTFFVAGSPPALIVPTPAAGETCKQFGQDLSATGFLIASYSGSKNDLVASSTPAFGETSNWNVKVTVTCTPTGPTPSDSPTGPTPSDSPTGG